MKTLVRLIIAAVIVLGTVNLNAQVNAKIGYINSAELVELMPGKDTIETQLLEYRQQLETQIQMMYQEYQNKVQDFQANFAVMSDIIKETKQREIGDLETRIQEFQQSADQDMANKQQQLYDPLISKARQAIQDVAEEHGYIYIFDVSLGTLLVYEKGDNVLPLVKAKLGL